MQNTAAATQSEKIYYNIFSSKSIYSKKDMINLVSIYNNKKKKDKDKI